MTTRLPGAPASPTVHEQVAALPRLDAVAQQPQVSGLEYWIRVVSWRHVAAAVVAVPLLFWVYAAALSRPLPGDFGTLVALALAAILGGLTLATYVPVGPRGREVRGQRVALTPCAAGPILPVMFASLLFEMSAMVPASGAVAVVVVAVGLVQRVFGSSACPR